MLKILLAEDNPINQKLATRMLEKRNHVVTVANNGREALDALAQQSFDLVLMDMQMPEMDGFEATRQLRVLEQGTDKHQPVVAMTALAMSGDKERCIAAGMDGYLSKPIRPQELDETLGHYIARKQAAPPVAEPEPPPVAAPVMIPAEESVDASQLLDRLDDDRALLGELVELFREDYPNHLLAARKAIDQNNAAALERAAHTVKGALGNLSAKQASALALELEMMGKTGDMSKAQSTLNQLANEIGNVIAALEAIASVESR